jgi:hypothetical protein
VWEYIDDMSFVGDAEAQPPSERIAYLVDHIRRVTTVGQSMARAGTHTVVPDRPRGANVTARIDALTAIYAAWAHHDTDVRFFRTSRLVRHDTEEFRAHVDGEGPYPEYELIAPNCVQSWVMKEHNRVAANGDGDEHVLQTVQNRRPDEASSTATLRYIADNQERILTVDRRSTLGELVKVADKLADRYRWTPTEAATFVITGRIPEVFVYTGSAQIRYGIDSSATTRVTMTLDPFLTPDQVADIYARLRAQLRTGSPRSLSVKHYTLAQQVGPHVRFYVQSPENARKIGRPPTPGPTGLAQFIDPVGGHTWQSLREMWNSKYSDYEEGGTCWRYDHASNFTRDAKTALVRLLDPAWRMWDQ